jgi:hypothetical protein
MHNKAAHSTVVGRRLTNNGQRQENHGEGNFPTDRKGVHHTVDTHTKLYKFALYYQTVLYHQKSLCIPMI